MLVYSLGYGKDFSYVYIQFFYIEFLIIDN